MKQCVIFCAAGFEALIAPLTGSELVIAADGGLRYTQALGVSPQAIIGDFDSLHYVPQGAEVFPVEKDDTDSMLAVKLGLSRGYDRFLLYGAMDGERLDHTVANYQLLSFLADRRARGVLVGNRFCATVIKNGGLRFPGGKEGDTEEILTLLAGSFLSEGITLSGGEPFCQPEAFRALAEGAHKLGKTVWAYSGYTYEQLRADAEKAQLLSLCDVLVDGPFLQEKKSLALLFRGSGNQRLIDVKRSEKAGEPVLWEDPWAAL